MTGTLAGWRVRLEPLARQHLAPLQDAVEDGDVCTLNYVNVPGRAGMADWIEKAIAMRDAGEQLRCV